MSSKHPRWVCHSCLVSTLSWVRSAETLAQGRLFSRAVIPAMLAWGSATPDNTAAIRNLSYAWSEVDRRFELRIRRTREPVWATIARSSARAKPRGWSAAAHRASVQAVVALVRRTGTSLRGRRERFLDPSMARSVRIEKRRLAVSEIAVELESAVDDNLVELGAALRASVLLASSVENWRHQEYAGGL